MKSPLHSLRMFVCVATLAALSARFALAGQGTASYFDVNGSTAGFGSPSGTSYDEAGSTLNAVSTTLTTGFANAQAVTSVTVLSTTGISVGQVMNGTGVPSGSVLVTAVNTSTKVVSVSFTSTAASTGNYTFGTGTWSTSSAGTAANTTGRPSGTQMTFGATGSDLAGATFSVAMDGNNNLQGLVVNSTSANITLTGSINTHANSGPNTWTVAGGSTLTVDTPRQGFDAGGTGSLKGFNCNGVILNITGGGTINYPSPLGCNSTALITENMVGGTLNFQMGSATPSGAGTYKGGFTLQAGTLNFASAGSANQFYGFTAGNNFTITGGTIDNTSGSPLTLNFAGGGGISMGGNFTFTGTSDLNLGTANVVLSTGSQVTTANGTLTIGGALTSGKLTKIGNGSLSLGATGSIGNGGQISVNAGTLSMGTGGTIASGGQINLGGGTLDVTGLGSGLALGSGATLSASANGTVNGTGTAIAAAAASTISVSSNTLSVSGNVTMNNVSNLFTLSPTTGGVNGQIAIAGNLDISAGITTNQIAYTSLATGRYKLITYTGTLTGSAAANLKLTGFIAAGRQTAVLDDSITGEIDLVVSGSAGNLTWVGDGSLNNWDTSTMDWSNQTTMAADHFFQADLVTFDDTGSQNPPVNITTTLSPGELLVTNSGSYVFTNSAGQLSGTMTLTKTGPGSLVLFEGADNFTGGILMGGGSLVLSNTGVSISGGVSVTNGTLTLAHTGTIGGGLTTSETGNALLDQAGTVTGNLTVGSGTTVTLGNNDIGGSLPTGSAVDNGTLAFNRTDNLTIPKVISGTGGLTKNGNNTLALSATNTYGGATTINSGKVLVNNAAGVGSSLGAVPGGSVTVAAGATIDVENAVANSIGFTNLSTSTAKQFFVAGAGVDGNGVIQNDIANTNQQSAFQFVTLTGDATFGGVGRWDIRGNGSIVPKLDLQGFTLTKTNAMQNSMVSVFVTPGNIIVTQGVMSFESASALNGAADGSQGIITVGPLGNFGHFRTSGGAITRPIVLNGGSLTNLSASGGGSTNDAPISLVANSTIYTAAGSDLYVNGVISGSFGFTKALTGNTWLSAAETYSGDTMISAGSLVLTNSGSLNNSAHIVIAGGAAFNVAATGFSLNSGQTLSNSTSTAQIDGNLSTGSGTVFLTYASGTPSMTITNGTLTLSGGTVFSVNNTGTALNAGSYKLISKATGGSVAGTAPSSVTVTGGGLTAGATTSLQITSGELYLIVKGSAAFSNLTASQSVTYGATSVTLSGTVSAPGPLYPANGETISVTINGNTQNTTVNDSTGDFSINYNASTIPASATPYGITYNYAGDASLDPASNSSSALTVNHRVVSLSGTRAFDGTTNAAAAILSVANKVGSDDVSVASGTGGLAGASAGVQAITSLGNLTLGGLTAPNYTLAGAGGSVTITQASSSAGLAASENPSGFKDSVSFTATVPALATGTVNFKTNGVLFDTETFSSGSATSLATTTLPRGTNTVIAEYAGDANYLGSTNSIGQVVTNHPPVIGNLVTNNETLGITFQISIASLSNSAAWSDVDNDNLTLSSVGPTSANGVSVTNDSDFIYYTLPVTNDDSFSYTITDGYTNVTSTVYITAVMANPTFSNLSASQAIAYGAASVSLSGTVSAAGPIYPANGETVSVTINGNTQSTTVNDSTGDFAIVYNTSALLYSAAPYAITYHYGGDTSLNPASDSSTTLTVNPRVVVLTGTRAFDGTTNAAAAILAVANRVGSDDVAVISGTGGLAGSNVGAQAITSLGNLALGGLTAPNYTLAGAGGSVIVTQAVTSVVLTSSENPSGFNDSVTFTSTVPAFATGTVNFKTNGVLFDSETLSSGVAVSIATTSLPRGTTAITAEYAGDANDLGSTNSINQVVTNHPPVIANIVTNGVVLNQTFQISIATLSNSAAWSDVDGDTLTLSSVGPTSANGVSVTSDGTTVFYNAGLTNEDHFTYTITDGFDTTTGTVYLEVLVPPAPATASIVISNHVPVITFTGSPNSTNVVRASTNIATNWVDISTNVADGSGKWQLIDTNAAGIPARFYRSYQPFP